jgi:hypothetical protein
MSAFESVCRFLRLPVSKDLFFAIFAVRRNLDKDGGCVWVSFHQRTSLFEVFNAGVANFRERFFLVRPRTEAALQSVLKIVDRPSGEGGVAPVRVPLIRFNWSRDHLKHELTMYRISYDKLTERDKDSFAKLVRFVNSFSRSVVVDDGGDPVMDLRGNPVTNP